MYNAAVKAISKIDTAVSTIHKACQEAGYLLLITADYSNTEQMLNPNTGAPHTAHTMNPTPFIMARDLKKFTVDKEDGEEEGALCDVMLTILDLLGLDQP